MANASIYEKIEKKGAEDATKILELGAQKAAEIERSILLETETFLNLTAKNNAEKRKNALVTKATEFEQNAKQRSLAKKKALIDEVFDLAAKRIQSLSDAQWKEWVISTLASDDLIGDEVIIASAADQLRFLSNFASNHLSYPVSLDLLNNALKNKKYTLSLSKELATCESGFFVIGDHFDIDHSTKTLLNALKDQYESDIASILFDGLE